MMELFIMEELNQLKLSMITNLESPISIILKSLRKKLVSKPMKAFPKQTLCDIQKILHSKHKPVYQYDIVSLYDHLSIYQDDSAFKKLDALIFPLSDNKLVPHVSIQLASIRLYCLIKYQMPFRNGLQVVRELVHEGSPTISELQMIIQISHLQNVRNDRRFQKLLEETLDILQEELQFIDIYSLISVYKSLQKASINVPKLSALNMRIQDIINQSSHTLPTYQIKLLSTVNQENRSWLFLFALRHRQIPWRKLIFFTHFLTTDLEWKQWALDIYGRSTIFSMLPFGDFERQYVKNMNEKMVFLKMGKPYFDELFEFEQIQDENGQIRTKLKDPEAQINSYINNICTTLYLGNGIESEQMLTKIQDVLEDISHLKKDIQSILAYFIVKHTIIFHRATSAQQKLYMENRLLQDTLFWLKSIKIKNKVTMVQPKKFITKLFVHLAAFEPQNYAKNNFENILTLISSYANNLVTISGKQNTNLSQINLLNQIIEKYTIGEQQQNQVISGQAKQYNGSTNPQLTISICKQVEVNKLVIVNYLLRIKDKSREKQVKILVDLACNQGKPGQNKEIGSDIKQYENIPIGMVWKHQYIQHWCKIKYVYANETSIEEFIQKIDNYNIYQNLA